MNTLHPPQTGGPKAPFAPHAHDTESALRLLTCGSVDDGKSTLIGRLLVDSKAVLQDQLAGVQRHGQTDLALLTDGLSAEREQGITIDVAYRYFCSARRKFIIADAPGHEQYTRNMVTAASAADAAVVLVDATKLPWADAQPALLAQTRRHSLLLKLLRVPCVVFAVNKLDAVSDSRTAFAHISAALHRFAQEAGIDITAIIPISALKGYNVIERSPQAHWCDYQGPTLLELLERVPVTPAPTDASFALPVQWVEKPSAAVGHAAQAHNPHNEARRVFWGRLASGRVQAGQRVRVMPAGHMATVAQVLNHVREPQSVQAGHSAGIVLEQQIDISRGDWLMAAPSAEHDGFAPRRDIEATIAWLDEQPLVPGRLYWALHGHRWTKARVTRIVHRLNIHTLAQESADQLLPNAIAQVAITLQEPLCVLPFAQSRMLGALILVDSASGQTCAAVLVN